MTFPSFLKPLDIVIVMLSFTITALFAFFVYGTPQKNAYVSIHARNKEWMFPLDAEEAVKAAGPLGDTVIEIHAGKARVLSSPCKNQSCVASGFIQNRGQWTACLPNDVLVAVEGGNDREKLDAAVW